jgi:hypothetical protein
MPKLSERMKTKLYSAISEPLTDSRLAVMKTDLDPKGQIDKELFMLEHRIWREVKAALNLKD